MTQCFKGGHDFPIEDEYGAYCEEHGVELIRKRAHDVVRPPPPLMPRPAADVDEQASRAT
ncbi:hypothetical protein [Streptomyces sp. NRRL F-5126]|uniref:hypothetical protein n=1 Tax=Streptomyces sp. NRRL F-5126 TaxID=1463857 RepID=UPI0004C89CE7|nr:hypothetical protein [Streptomyces sp. NRRL F-5126]